MTFESRRDFSFKCLARSFDCNLETTLVVKLIPDHVRILASLNFAKSCIHPAY